MRLTRLGIAVVFASMCSAAFAQGPSLSRPRLRANQRPTISPYIDLLRANSSSEFGFQLFRRVGPSLRSQNQAARFQSDVRSLQQQIDRTGNEPIQGGVSGTGHRVGFQTHLRYFGTPLGQSTGRRR